MEQALRTGTVIGGVTIRELLGHGGFGITYLTEDNRSGQLYALKEYFPAELARRGQSSEVGARPERAEAFEIGRRTFFEEANTLRKLPPRRGLVRVRGAFVKNGTVYCLMEFIEGEPLDRLIARYARDRRTVPEDLVVDFIQAITSALAAVHAEGLIHRDIKPANIMIRRSDGQPVLIDFGAARHFNRDPDLASIFTREYAPIEQMPLDWGRLNMRLREGPWTDLFALSVLLHRMISYRLPLDAEARLMGLHATGRDSYVPVARVLREVQPAERYSRRLTDLIDYGCQLLPADRPADADAFAGLLEPGGPVDPTRLRTHARFGSADPVSDVTALRRAFVEARPGAAPPGIEAQPLMARPPRRRRRLLLFVVVLAALVALVYGLAGGTTFREFAGWWPV